MGTIVLNNISYTKQHHRHYISNMKVLSVSVFLFVSVAMARPDGPPPPPAEYGPAAYSYTWAVKDDYTSNNYGQNEDRNGFVYILFVVFSNFSYLCTLQLSVYVFPM